jgi:pimeloyl-ACP methyl ester carboxylesterase
MGTRSGWRSSLEEDAMGETALGSRTTTWVLVAALLLVLGGGYLAHWTQTVGGTVAVRDVRFMGPNGTMLSALLYVPEGATAKTPAPAILAVHGYINSRETQTPFAVEFARRGYVVLALDQTGHGFSDPPALGYGFGGPDALKYLRSLDIVDPANIGLEGHSMGGWTVLSAAGKYPNDYKSMVILGSVPGLRGAPEGSPEFPRNIRVVFSTRDEFSGLMYGVPRGLDAVRSPRTLKLFGVSEPVEPGKMYGSLEAGTARQLMQPANIHTGDHFWNEPVGQAIEWFQMTLKGGKDIAPTEQIWFRKEFGTALAMLGMFLAIFPIGALLLRSAYFSPLAGEEPPARAIVGGGWWIAAALTLAIPVVTFFRFQHFVDAPYKASWWLPQNLTTGIMFWALGNAVISAVLFAAWHVVLNRRKGATARHYGLSWDAGFSWRMVGRSFLLAATITASAYGLLAASDWLFKTDFRFFVFAVKPMSVERFAIFLKYLAPFTLYTLVLAVILHGQLRQTTAAGMPVSLPRAIVTNVLLAALGILGLEVFQYAPMYLGGGTLAIPTEPLLTILGYQFIPLLSIVAAVSTYFFRKTGHVYVGAFLNSMLITWIVVAGQATHFRL